jgi:hypothetical protein
MQGPQEQPPLQNHPDRRGMLHADRQFPQGGSPTRLQYEPINIELKNDILSFA